MGPSVAKHFSFSSIFWQFLTALDIKIIPRNNAADTDTVLYSVLAAEVWAIIQLKTQLNYFGLKIWQKDLSILKRKTGQCILAKRRL